MRRRGRGARPRGARVLFGMVLCVGCMVGPAAASAAEVGGVAPASAAEVAGDAVTSAAEVAIRGRAVADSVPGPRLTLQSVYADVEGPPVLLERTDGLEVDHGWNVFATVGDRFQVHDRISASYRVRAGRSARGNRLDVRELMAHLRLGSWTLSAGRGTRRLGRGERGRLLLDDNAAAFDMVELRTREPVRLPGFMASWGEFGFDVLNGVLPFADEMPHDPRYVTAGKPVARPNLLAMRMTYAPTDWLEVGMTRTALYGGVGRERYDTFGEWWDLLTARNENRSTGDGRGGDQMAAVDLEVSVPWLEGVGPIDEVRGWVEYAGTDIHAGWQGDDTHSWFPFVLTDVAVLSGGSVRMGSTTLTVEHVRVHPDWYRHSGYPQGYSNDRIGMGHPVGSDAARMTSGLLWNDSDEMSVSCWVAWDRRLEASRFAASPSAWRVLVERTLPHPSGDWRAGLLIDHDDAPSSTGMGATSEGTAFGISLSTSMANH